MDFINIPFKKLIKKNPFTKEFRTIIIRGDLYGEMKKKVPITTLPVDIFSNTKNVEDLEITDCLTELDETIIKDLTKLNTLTLNKNNFTTLSETLFKNNVNLTKLEIRNSNEDEENKDKIMVTLPENIFKGLDQLVYLKLDRNRFTETLPVGLFKGLTKLKELDLGTNLLPSLPEGIFKGLINLEHLDIGDNKFTTLPAGIFQGLPKLKYLFIMNNKLTTLPAGIFDGLTAEIRPDSLKELVEEEEDDEALEGDENTCYSVIDLYDKNIDKFLTKDPGNFILVFNRKKECESLKNLRKQYFSAELNDYEGYYECKQSVMDSQKQTGFTQTAFRKGDYYPDVEYVKVGSANHYIVKPDWFYKGPVPEPRMFKLVSTGNKKPLLSKRIAKNYGTNVVSDVHCDPMDTFEICRLEPVLNKASTPKQTAQQTAQQSKSRPSKSRPSKSRPSKSKPSKSKSRRSRIYVLNRTRRHSTLRNTNSNDINVGGMRKPKQKKKTRKNYKR